MKIKLSELFGIKPMACCVVCGAGYYDKSLALCPKCLAEIARQTIRPCRLCGKMPYECKCSGASVRSVMWYRGRTVKGMMHKFKHHTDVLLTELIADFCVDMLISQGVSKRVDAVVPIPSRAKDRHFKGYGHAETLAKCIADKLDLPYIEAIERTGAQQQKLLSASQRKRAIALSFKPLRKCCQKPDGTIYSRILLIDDITTTGATLMCCAALLRRAGVKQVVCFTPAKTARQRH